MSRILVIDDDKKFREFIAEELEKAGNQVFRARHGREGMQIWREQQLDLVITDIFMPEMDGFEVIKQLRWEYPGLPILVMHDGSEALDTLVFVEMALNVGAREHLIKPFDREALLLTVERCLETVTDV